MSKSYSANQFENAFVSTKMRNWEVPKKCNESNIGVSRKATKKPLVPIIDDRYHLLPTYKQQSGQDSNIRKFSNFVSTWDMPKKLPSYKMDVKTGRDERAYEQLQEEYKVAREILNGTRPPDSMLPKKLNAGSSSSSSKYRNDNSCGNEKTVSNNSQYTSYFDSDIKDTSIPYHVDDSQLQDNAQLYHDTNDDCNDINY
ncbi:hypothetical protein HELRODRAFT_172003 [Helobdella robusta]|uniref:Cilia- and flagella-associated protein 126 n=1 Tax=Helobdella robusta TaxID=6412 RepID=T1F4X6_HELRO|nr:hypothetical protein HELRODRAFT_172003 [Helobdella robusta]ESO04994.1 hypothetical protein HELRODRAFT_172003 [Helobdella robusta]